MNIRSLRVFAAHTRFFPVLNSMWTSEGASYLIKSERSSRKNEYDLSYRSRKTKLPSLTPEAQRTFSNVDAVS